mmetsp:Transcript_76048/g.204060  ORF Transcript_76048/g.204060 Transcript_76048/m.204060 type:complete len:257 (-) Transcript_76048:28-798(-)
MPRNRLLLRLARPAQVRQVRSPPKAQNVTHRHTKPKRNTENEDVARPPEAPQRLDVHGSVVDVLGDAVTSPVHRVVALPLQELLHSVEAREVDARKEEADVKNNLLHNSQHPSRVLQLLAQRSVGKLLNAREPLLHLVHKHKVLEPSEVHEAENKEHSVPLEVHLVQRLLLKRNLRKEVRPRALGKVDDHLEPERVRLAPSSDRRADPARAGGLGRGREPRDLELVLRLLPHGREQGAEPPHRAEPREEVHAPLVC